MMTEEVSDWDEDVSSEVSGSKRDSLNLSFLDCWDYLVELECLKGSQDLQLAAELGKTLLERNKELETSLRQCQNIIDEQVQEIEYLTKQSTALRKASDDRIRIYEHLEVSIQELERANQKLALDNSTDKKQIKSLCAYRDMLEARCDELQKALDDAMVQQAIQKEKLKRLPTIEEGSPKKTTCDTSVNQIPIEQLPADEDVVNRLTVQNQELKSQMSRDQRKIAGLEEEIYRREQGMALLEEELSQREDQVKSLLEKMSNLEEVRSENLCARCLKKIDLKMPEEYLILSDPEEASTEDNKDNYRSLAEACESIVKEQWEIRKLDREFSKPYQLNCMSLQDELKPFNFNGYNFKKEPEEEEENQTQNKDEKKEAQKNSSKNKVFFADFSETETSSSGFSDETSNKSTQTERNLIPGSFLCSIADGDDCKFSIYDDACPIESRFRKTPEYRTLFREIFAVLKRAAEAKENGEQLPLLDDLTPVSEAPKVPPVTPAKEEPSIDFEDVQSNPESVAASEAASETSFSVNDKGYVDLKEPVEKNQPVEKNPGKSDRDVRLTDDILEYISVGIGVKKKSRKRSTNSPAKRITVSELVDGLETSLPNSPRKSGGRRRKEWRTFDSSRTSPKNQSPAIQPHVLTTLERKETPPDARNKTTSSWLFQPLVSTAAQDVAKLKKLDKTYAEVLRLTPKKFVRPKGVSLVS